MKKKPHQKAILQTSSAEYGGLIGGIAELLEAARRTAARTINALMTATYWEIGRRIVEFEQGGEKRAEYGEGLMARLADDLTARFGRGFSRQNLQRFRLFYLSQPAEKICSTLSSKLTGGIGSTPSNELRTIVQTLSARSKMAKIRPTPSDISQAPSGKSSLFALSDLARGFPLPWSHYVLLISRTRSPEAFAFYHAEALRGGWSVRQLDRQIASQFYEPPLPRETKMPCCAKGGCFRGGFNFRRRRSARSARSRIPRTERRILGDRSRTGAVAAP